MSARACYVCFGHWPSHDFPLFSRSARSRREIIPFDRWELLPDQIEYGEELGRGAFGVVYKATLKKRQGIEVFDTRKGLQPSKADQVVAVKELQGTFLVNDFVMGLYDWWSNLNMITHSHRTSRLSFSDFWSNLLQCLSVNNVQTFSIIYLFSDDPREEQKEEFLYEIAQMKLLGSHQNVVSLVGCCTIQEHKFLVIEYVPFGDLLQWLRRRRRSVGYKGTFKFLK